MVALADQRTEGPLGSREGWLVLRLPEVVDMPVVARVESRLALETCEHATLDFTHVRACSISALCRLMAYAANLSAVAIHVRGLTEHYLKVLRYLRLEPSSEHYRGPWTTD
jgi:hypothetical protein